MSGCPLLPVIKKDLNWEFPAPDNLLFTPATCPGRRGGRPSSPRTQPASCRPQQPRPGWAFAQGVRVDATGLQPGSERGTGTPGERPAGGVARRGQPLAPGSLSNLTDGHAAVHRRQPLSRPWSPASEFGGDPNKKASLSHTLASPGSVGPAPPTCWPPSQVPQADLPARCWLMAYPPTPTLDTPPTPAGHCRGCHQQPASCSSRHRSPPQTHVPQPGRTPPRASRTYLTLFLRPCPPESRLLTRGSHRTGKRSHLAFRPRRLRLWFCFNKPLLAGQTTPPPNITGPEHH